MLLGYTTELATKNYVSFLSLAVKLNYQHRSQLFVSLQDLPYFSCFLLNFPVFKIKICKMFKIQIVEVFLFIQKKTCTYSNILFHYTTQSRTSTNCIQYPNLNCAHLTIKLNFLLVYSLSMNSNNHILL